MFREIIENIRAAEKDADAMEKEAALKAREIRFNAHNAAGEYAEAAEKALKAEIKDFMLKASKEGDKKAAEMAKESEGLRAAVTKAAEKHHEQAVERIIKEFKETV